MLFVLGSISWTTGALSGFLGIVLTAAAFVVNTRRDGRREKAETEDRTFGRRDIAREEALDLAEVRGGAISELQRELAELKERYERERGEQLITIGGLQRTIDLMREQAFETLQVYAHGQRALLLTILGDLDRDPPNVAHAMKRIHDALSDPHPKFPGHPPA
jgi:hypothetical protein